MPLSQNLMVSAEALIRAGEVMLYITYFFKPSGGNLMGCNYSSLLTQFSQLLTVFTVPFLPGTLILVLLFFFNLY